VKSQIEIDINRNLAVKRREMIEYLRPVQKEAVDFLIACEHGAFVIMPTGSGKTALMPIFKVEGRCSIVFAPYKLLVDQLAATLSNSVAYPFESSFDVLACADFIVMPYEAAVGSADLFSVLHDMERLGPVWIDEVRVEYS